MAGVFSFTPSDADQGARLDLFLSGRPAIALTRSHIQSLITHGRVRVNGQPAKPSYKLRPGDRIRVEVPPPEPLIIKPEAVRFDIRHEDDTVIVLSKPPGLVVHPAPGHTSGTLVNGLLAHAGNLSGVGGPLRPGIVHRLDKDTSGLMVAAKHDTAHIHLARQFKKGAVKKEYLALVHGPMQEDTGEIDLPIARHPERRKEMAVARDRGRRALTLWRKMESFTAGVDLLSITLKTGRTHQIRVHLSHMGHPVVGDAVYGYGRKKLKKQFKNQAELLLSLIHRHLLHAHRLGFVHPASERYVEYESPMPEDMSAVLTALRNMD